MFLLVFHLLAVVFLATVVQECSATMSDLGTTQRLFWNFERLATNSLQPRDHEAVVTFQSIMEGMNNTKESFRMLYTYEQQARIFKQIFGKNTTMLAEVLAEPDSCSTIEAFLGFIFDNAVDLLAHRAGRKHDLMRGFQQVLHVRAVLKAVLIKQGRHLYEPVSSDICIDKAFIALYGWVKGALTAEAKTENTFRLDIPESTDVQRNSLKTKRDIVTFTTLDKELNLTVVKPLPGVDYPE